MRYINSATTLLPNFDEVAAGIFTVALLGETITYSSQAYKKDRSPDALKNNEFLNRMELAKDLQFVEIVSGYFAHTLVLGYFDSNSKQLMGRLLIVGPMFPRVSDGIARFSKEAWDKLYAPWFPKEKSEADWKSLISFVHVIDEMANIASKVLGSLATGIVVQKMATGDATGKIRLLVSTALLAISTCLVVTQTSPDRGSGATARKFGSS